MPFPVFVNIDCFGTENQNSRFIKQFVNVKENYDLMPRGMSEFLDLTDVDYNRVSVYTQSEPLFLKDNTIAIGRGAFGNLTNMENDREAFKKKYAELYLQDKKGAIALAAGTRSQKPWSGHSTGAGLYPCSGR